MPNESAAHPESPSLGALTDIAHVLSSQFDTRAAFAKVMQIISDRLGLHRGTVVLLDDATGRLRTETAHGIAAQDIERNRFAMGEGVTGAVVATGRARIIPDLRNDPDFLNRTGRLSQVEKDQPVSFICVPIRIETRVAGALAVDTPFVSDETLRSNQTLAEIIAAFLAQAIQINRMVMRQKDELLEENAALRAQVRDRFRFENIVGDSPAMHEVFNVVGQVANSRATVLLLGETGTGKEMIAKAVHYNSPRREKPFIRVNCGALTGTLLESELFGHVKGSFTGAIRDKIGRFEAADGGTIFLDEIGEMPLDMQTRLLRVIEEGTVQRIGDSRQIPVDVRIIAASNRELLDEVERGNFRRDLFYRLNVLPIRLPALRERKEDIPILVRLYMDKLSKKLNKKPVPIGQDYMDALSAQPWPGNIRELENMLELIINTERLPDLSGPAAEEGARLPFPQGSARQRPSGLSTLEDAEASHIRSALSSAGNNVSHAAKSLGIGRNTLYRKMQRYRIAHSAEDARSALEQLSP